MKNIKYKILTIFVALTFLSCTEDFFDSQENQYITEDRINEIKNNPESLKNIINSAFAGAYSDLISYQRGHDDAGLKSFMLAGDLTGLDMVQTKHHWFGWDYDFDYYQAPYRRTRTFWDVYYKQINIANRILDDYMSKAPAGDAWFVKKKAEALTIRGIAYYYLINLYQQNVIGNEEKPGVPLLLKLKDENLPRAKVKDVYNSLISDLRFGAEKGEISADVRLADKAVAATYLAKAYAAKQQWDSVAYFAQIASDAKPLTAKNIVESGKWDVSNPSWLWGYKVTNLNTAMFASFYSHIDNNLKGYAGALSVYKSIYSNLYDKISDTDVRKKIYINKAKFPEIASKYPNLPDYANIKYITPDDFTGDYSFLRVEDPYLLLIEAKVELNQLGEAKSLLENLMKLRDDKYDVSKFNSQDELREEARLQRRIELWGEGTSFYDLKRWQLGVDRTVAGSNHRTKIVVPAGDKRWVYQIPQHEMDTNPNIGEQNP